MCWSEPAVAARTAVHAAANLRLGVGGTATTTALGHAVDVDGDLLVAVSDRQVSTLARFVTAAAGDVLPGTAVAIDLAPVAVADRVRRTVTLQGQLVTLTGSARAAARRLIRAREHQRDPLVWDADAHVLRLEPTSIVTTATCWCAGAPKSCHDSVDPADYLAAEPDPLSEVEGEWLCHLAADHGTALTAMAMSCAPWLDEVSLEVSPLAVDRDGLRLRVRTSELCRDLHLAFDEPVACPCEANRALNALMDQARPAIS